MIHIPMFKWSLSLVKDVFLHLFFEVVECGHDSNIINSRIAEN